MIAAQGKAAPELDKAVLTPEIDHQGFEIRHVLP